MAQTMMAKVIPELIDMQALQEQQRKQSVIFLEVPPNMATENAPQDSKHYSNNNSKAANQKSEKAECYVIYENFTSPCRIGKSCGDF